MDQRDEEPGFFDRPENVTKIFHGVVVLSVLLVAGDLLYEKHVHYGFEGWFGFYGFYGFVSCVGLVLAAKELRKVVKRDEDYYD